MNDVKGTSNIGRLKFVSLIIQTASKPICWTETVACIATSLQVTAVHAF